MKALELRKKSIDELKRILRDLREKLRKLRFDLVSGKLKNFREIRKTKREIARVLTVINEKK